MLLDNPLRSEMNHMEVMTNDNQNYDNNIMINDNYEDGFNENENENNINKANSNGKISVPCMNTANFSENDEEYRNEKNVNISSLTKKKSDLSKMNNENYEYNSNDIKQTIDNYLDKILNNQKCKQIYKLII